MISMTIWWFFESLPEAWDISRYSKFTKFRSAEIHAETLLYQHFDVHCTLGELTVDLDCEKNTLVQQWKRAVLDKLTKTSKFRTCEIHAETLWNQGLRQCCTLCELTANPLPYWIGKEEHDDLLTCAFHGYLPRYPFRTFINMSDCPLPLGLLSGFLMQVESVLLSRLFHV